MKRGEHSKLISISLDNFSKFAKTIPDDPDAQIVGYLAMIAQHTALIADRLMDLVMHEKENDT